MVSEKAITYTMEFKSLFLEEYNSGKLPTQIFIDMNINPYIVSRRRINSTTQRIKAIWIDIRGISISRIW